MLSEMCVPFEREVVVKFHDAPRKFARIDLFWRTRFGAILFEVDEYAHKGPRYCIDYECQRMSLIFEELSKKFSRIHIIRYNPHPVRGQRKPTDEERKEQIRLALSLDPQRPLTISYLFYHMQDGFPEIALSPLYTLREHIRLQDQ